MSQCWLHTKHREETLKCAPQPDTALTMTSIVFYVPTYWVQRLNWSYSEFCWETVHQTTMTVFWDCKMKDVMSSYNCRVHWNIFHTHLVDVVESLGIELIFLSDRSPCRLAGAGHAPLHLGDGQAGPEVGVSRQHLVGRAQQLTQLGQFSHSNLVDSALGSLCNAMLISH